VLYAVLAVIFIVVALGVASDYRGWWQLIVFAIAPDLTLLMGMSSGLQRGQLHPRAVPFYNAVHRYWVPGFLIVISVLVRSPEWLVAGLAWSAHISVDRSLGFGLRTPEGFQRAEVSRS
jgi:hypothetical protein